MALNLLSQVNLLLLSNNKVTKLNMKFFLTQIIGLRYSNTAMMQPQAQQFSSINGAFGVMSSQPSTATTPSILQASNQMRSNLMSNMVGNPRSMITIQTAGNNTAPATVTPTSYVAAAQTTTPTTVTPTSMRPSSAQNLPSSPLRPSSAQQQPSVVSTTPISLLNNSTSAPAQQDYRQMMKSAQQQYGTTTISNIMGYTSPSQYPATTTTASDSSFKVF